MYVYLLTLNNSVYYFLIYLLINKFISIYMYLCTVTYEELVISFNS